MIYSFLKARATPGRALLLVLAVVCAALLTGDCTAREETAPGGFVPVIAASYYGGYRPDRGRVCSEPSRVRD